MKNRELNVGVIVPPNKIEKPVLYSSAEADLKLKQLKQDIYTQRKPYSFEDKKQTPKLIKWGAILTGIAAAGLLILTKFKK